MEKKLTFADIQYIKGAYEEGWPVEEIADSLNISSGTVSRIAIDNGCAPRQIRTSPDRKPDTKSKGPSIDEQIEKLREDMKRMEVNMRTLESQRKMTFTYDPDQMTVTITGVDRLFIAHEGVAKFREWLVKQFSM